MTTLCAGTEWGTELVANDAKIRQEDKASEFNRK